mgnify:CR=1 FL=1
MLKQMIAKWPFFYSMMDILDWILAKTNRKVWSISVL